MKKAMFAAILMTLMGSLAQAQTLPPTTPQTPQSNLPQGWLDVVSEAMVAGWAVDFDSPNEQVMVNVTSETNGKTKLVASLLTTYVRRDVNMAYGIQGTHGYRLPNPAQLCDGVQHTIRVHAVDAQGIPASIELFGSPKTIRCGSPKPVGIIKGLVSNEWGQPLTADHQVRVTLNHFLPSGEAVWSNFINPEPGVVGGGFNFTSDYEGEPLVVGDEYEVVISASDYIYRRMRFQLTSGVNTIAMVLTYVPLSIYHFAGESPVIAARDGQLKVQALVCSNSYSTGIMRADVVFSGPGKVSERNEVTTQYYFFVPSVGWCDYINIALPVDSGLPDGHYYCARVKIGPMDQEGYSEITTCAPKGVTR